VVEFGVYSVDMDTRPTLWLFPAPYRTLNADIEVFAGASTTGKARVVQVDSIPVGAGRALGADVVGAPVDSSHC
jgi:hypothetical protein